MSAPKAPSIKPEFIDAIHEGLIHTFEELERLHRAKLFNEEIAPEPAKTESPLESELFVALASCGFTRDDSAEPGIARLYQQAPVVTHRGTFRLDLAAIRRVDKFVLKLAIEVDGHDFHRADKKQIERDCRRDRALIRAGWRVLRYPGSEVHRDPGSCALDVAGIVIEWVDQVSRLL